MRLPPPHDLLILALWVLWAIYWGIAAIGTKAVLWREGWRSRLFYMAPVAVGIVLVSSRRLMPAWLGAPLIAPAAPGLYGAGVTLALCGFAIAIWARRRLGGNWSGLVTLKRDHELVRSGPYRFVRHPIYTGLLLAVIGTELAANQRRGIAIVALILFGITRKIRIEERLMDETFGAQYAAYRAEVRALVPGIW